MNLKQVAVRLGLSPATVAYYLSHGLRGVRLEAAVEVRPSYRIVRISEKQLQRFAAAVALRPPGQHVDPAWLVRYRAGQLSSADVGAVS